MLQFATNVEAADILLQSVSYSRDNVLVTGVVIYLPQRSIGQLPCDDSRITEFSLLAIVIEQEVLATQLYWGY